MTSSQDNKSFTTDDLFELKQLSDPQFSPDGQQIAFVITSPDRVANDYKEHIGLYTNSGKKFLLLMEGTSPSWSPDGRYLAYIGSDERKVGLWIFHLEKEIREFIAPLHDSAYFIDHMAINNFEWSPDGEKIAFVSTDANSDQAKEVRVFDSLMYKSKGGRSRPYYAEESTSGIWVVSMEDKRRVNLTLDAYHAHSLSWSPDGGKILFVSNRTSNFDYNHDNKLYTVEVESGQIQAVGEDQTTVYMPSWSPDGQYMAYIANTSQHNAKDSPSEDYHLFVKSVANGSEHCLTKSLDRRVENLQWQPDGRSIYFTSGDQGITTIYKADIDSQHISRILNEEFHISEFSVAGPEGKIAFISSGSMAPPELYLIEAENSTVFKLTHFNENLADRNFQTAESFWYDSFDHTQIQGWLTKPASFDEDTKYPLILVIHGGPHNMFGYEFQDRTQILSAHGYGVLCINPRGSSGYGQNFSRGNSLNWGGKDYKDLMQGVDFVLEEHSWIDPERLGVTGQSYGGYMTNWIITQTDRFKAAVSDGGISNLISFTGTSVFHLLLEDEFDGKPWDRYPLLWQWSPLRNVRDVSTPTLFFHGEKDNEVPMSQTEELFTALKKLGVATRFVKYVGEGHGWRPDLKPKNRADLFNRMLSWFDHYL